MDFSLTEEQQLIRTMVREFARAEIAPIAAAVDREHRFPRETVKRMGELGLFGLFTPENLEGGGGDYLSYILAIEEVAAVCASHAAILSVHTSTCLDGILKFGNEAQRVRYVPDLATGRKLGGLTVTEAGAGTDLAALKTTAVRKGDTYVVNGNKMFITNGGIAETCIVAAVTDPSRGAKGISAFIVESGFPGFVVGQKEDKMGIRGSQTAEIIYKDCEIPAENLLGNEGDGFKIVMQILDGGRIGIGAQAVGIARAALDAAVGYVKERRQFGKPLAANQGLQWMIADMALKIEASRNLVHKAAWAKASGKRFTVEAAMAKLMASETAMDVTTKAVQLHGGIGYTTSYPVERFMRDAKITEIYEGTSEVQRMIISAAWLK